jgi:hypothetical protein
LLSAAIIKVRPIQLRDYSSPGARVSRDNEFFAAWAGLAICAELADDDRLWKLKNLPNYSNWFEDLIYFMVRRHDASEALILAFETLSLSWFPENFKKSDD